jgi:hydrogenase-4 component F
MLHAVNHSLTKGMLFLVAGNILAFYKTKSTTEVRGVVRALPVSGVLWVAGFLSITGSPPFGPFLSELVILKAALDQGHLLVAVAYLGLLGVIFIGMATTVLGMYQGLPAVQPAGMPSAVAGDGEPGFSSGKRKAMVSRAVVDSPPGPYAESLLAVIPPMALGAAVLVLGLYVPPVLRTLLMSAAGAISG